MAITLIGLNLPSGALNYKYHSIATLKSAPCKQCVPHGGGPCLAWEDDKARAWPFG